MCYFLIYNNPSALKQSPKLKITGLQVSPTGSVSRIGILEIVSSEIRVFFYIYLLKNYLKHNNINFIITVFFYYLSQ